MSEDRYLRRHDVNFCLAHLSEELAEVQQAIGKALRWGLESSNPELPEDQRESNAAAIVREMDDVTRSYSRLYQHILYQHLRCHVPEGKSDV